MEMKFLSKEIYFSSTTHYINDMLDLQKVLLNKFQTYDLEVRLR